MVTHMVTLRRHGLVVALLALGPSGSAGWSAPACTWIKQGHD